MCPVCEIFVVYSCPPSWYCPTFQACLHVLGWNPRILGSYIHVLGTCPRVLGATNLNPHLRSLPLPLLWGWRGPCSRRQQQVCSCQCNNVIHHNNQTISTYTFTHSLSYLLSHSDSWESVSSTTTGPDVSCCRPPCAPVQEEEFSRNEEYM